MRVFDRDNYTYSVQPTDVGELKYGDDVLRVRDGGMIVVETVHKNERVASTQILRRIEFADASAVVFSEWTRFLVIEAEAKR